MTTIALPPLDSRTWTTDRFSDEAVRAIQSCRKYGQAAAQHGWMAGAYLSLLHDRLVKGRRWAAWLRQHQDLITEDTARWYILLHERTGDRSKLEGLTLTEAYAAFGITKFIETAGAEPGSNGAGPIQGSGWRDTDHRRLLIDKDMAQTENQDEESPDRRTYYNFRLGKLRPRACDQETPPGLARFLFETIRPVYEVETILDPCAGQGALTRPWRGRPVVAFEIDEGRDFFQCPDRIDCDLVLCNAPFSQEAESVTGYQPEQFLRRIVEVVPRHTPIVLITPMGMRLHQEKRSKRWRWLRDEAPAINSIISLPRDAFPSVDYHVEILLFNIPKLKPHFFLPDRYL